MLILASASAGRRRLLESAGVPFRAEPAGLDEESVRIGLRAESAPVGETALALATAKARLVSARRPGSLVLGADQMLECGGRQFDKAADLAAARRHLEALQGRSHSLVTAAVLVEDGECLWRHAEVCRMTMRPLSAGSIAAYLAEVGDSVLGSVGCYHVEGRGVRLFAAIEGDWHAVIGLPLLALLDALVERGVVEP